MTLVYRSVFTDSDGRIGKVVPRLFTDWLGSKDLDVPPQGLTKHGAALDSKSDDIAWAAATSSRLGDGSAISRLRLIEEKPEARWVTTVSWRSLPTTGGSASAEDEGAWVWVDLEHEPVGGPTLRPGSPRLVRELLAAGEAYDGPVPLTAEVWNITAGHVAELARYVTASERSLPIVVFAHDGQRVYDQERLAQRLARDLAGVAAVFRLEDGAATERLAELLPRDYAVYGGAMRTYLPGAGGPTDTPSRHRVLGRASLVALGARAFPAVKDQILSLSVTRAAPITRRSPASQMAGRLSERRTPLSPASVGTEWLVAQLRKLRARLGSRVEVPEDDHRLPDSVASAIDLLVDDTAKPASESVTPAAPDPSLQRELDASREESQLLEDLLEQAQRELDQSEGQLAQLRTELEDLQIEATESVEAVERRERRIRWLERRVRELGDPGVGVDDALPEAPPSVAEVLELARTTLANVVIGDTDSVAAELDLHPGSQLYAVKSWAALVALDAYTAARGRGDFNNSFYAWCAEPLPGEPAISAAAVALVESDTVQTNPSLRDARTFDVPQEVDPSGRVYMPAHVKVVKRGAPCPRLHFHDATGSTGKVYVGYLGEHLPTARFS